MGLRLDLQALLESIMGNGKVYFQPPDSLTMQYPCIVYSKDRGSYDHGDNLPYRYTQGYQVTLISRNPEDTAFGKLVALPLCRFDRHFAASGLNHDVFTLYF